MKQTRNTLRIRTKSRGARIQNKACLLLLLVMSGALLPAHGQELQPGFQWREAEAALLGCTASRGDSSAAAHALPELWQHLQREPAATVPFVLECWKRQDAPQVLLSVRLEGDQPLWKTNRYAAMLPARGSLALADGREQPYAFGSTAGSAVHALWTLAGVEVGAMVKVLLDSLHTAGVKDVLLSGMHEGGAVAMLVLAQAHLQKTEANLPAALRIKLYSFGAPKVGNREWHQGIDSMTTAGWIQALSLPGETCTEWPLTLQWPTDLMSDSHPYAPAPSKRLQKALQRAEVETYRYAQALTGAALAAIGSPYRLPAFAESSFEAGPVQVLPTDSGSVALTVVATVEALERRQASNYLEALRLLKPLESEPAVVDSALTPDARPVPEAAPAPSGTWRLVYISRPLDAFQAMYPTRKPSITFDAAKKIMKGYTGCNEFTVRYAHRGSVFYLVGTPAVDQGMCEGLGELHFLETLKSVSRYTIAPDGYLLLQQGPTTLMRFKPVKP